MLASLPPRLRKRLPQLQHLPPSQRRNPLHLDFQRNLRPPMLSPLRMDQRPLRPGRPQPRPHKQEDEEELRPRGVEAQLEAHEERAKRTEEVEEERRTPARHQLRQSNSKRIPLRLEQRPRHNLPRQDSLFEEPPVVLAEEFSVNFSVKGDWVCKEPLLAELRQRELRQPVRPRGSGMDRETAKETRRGRREELENSSIHVFA